MAILHVALASDWVTAVAAGSYRESTRGATLDEVGFIHCSTSAQLTGVAEFVFAGVVDELVVLVLSASAIAAAGVPLRYEDGGDGRLFPHLYAAILPSFVSAVMPARFEGDRFVVELPAETDAAASVERELALLEPAVRADPTRVGELLAPDFREVGHSGAEWSRADLLASIEPLPAGLTVTELSAEDLAPGVVLLRYRTERASGTAALRSSIWLRSPDGLRLRYHQGTPAPS